MKEELNLGLELLPAEIFEHFELTHIEDSTSDVQLFLDEKPQPPGNSTYISKGFTEQAVIQDFSIRGKATFLHIRRRKWLDTKTGKIITQKYDLAHLGTQITNEFAAFLKGIY